MPVRHATLHQLRIFEAVARHLSFARAAEELHLTPAAVSIQVKQLAASAGQPLFEQVGKRIHLTAAGELTAAAGRDLQDRLERLAQELAGLEGLESGVVRLGILTTAKYFVPRLLGEFCAAHPGVDATLFVGNRQALLARLAENRDDLYVLGRPPEHISAQAVPFADNPLVVVARPDHPLAGAACSEPEALEGLPFILREPGSGTRLAVERFFADRGVAVRVRMELGSNEAIKQAVAGGLGLAVLSASTLRSELASGDLAVLPVRGFPLAQQWYLAHAAGKQLSPAARAFREHLVAASATPRRAGGGR